MISPKEIASEILVENTNYRYYNFAIMHYKNMPMQYIGIFLAVKIKNFIEKKNDIFDIYPQNIDSGSTLELPQ